MAEYIERDDALNAIERSYWTEGAYERVERLPAADVEPVKHGKWIKQEGQWLMMESGETVNIHLCSCCGGYFKNAPYKYCPNCGARMDGG